MLKIRLQRIGKRGQAYFRVVVMEHTRQPKGKYLEDLGAYDPHKNEISVDVEKVKYWLSHGAKTSPTVNNLLVGHGIIDGEKVRAWKVKPRGTSEARKAPEATEVKDMKERQGPEIMGQETEKLETNEERKSKESELLPEPAPVA